jgi:RNA-splicing ligase RtcB
MEEFKKDMQNITANVTQSTLNEAPRAYKPIEEVMKAQNSSVKIVKHLIPIINWKG